MNKSIKIIELVALRKIKSRYHPAKESDEYFLASWAGLISKRLKKENPELDIELWQVDNEFKKMRTKTIEGIKCKIYPYSNVIIRNCMTLKMISHLKKYQKYYAITIHYHSIYNIYFNLFIHLFFPSIKIVLTHHGGLPGRKNNTKNILKRRLLLYTYRRFTSITYLRKEVRSWICSANSHPPLYFLPLGADFNVFTPIEKGYARSKLGLKDDVVYGIFVGRFYSLKRVDLLLDIYHSLTNKYNFSIIFVGGYPDDLNDMYDQVAKSGCPYWNYQKWQSLKYFYSAADFFIHPVFHEQFGGIDVSWMEALACNRPVLSSMLDQLDFNYDDLGILLSSESEVEYQVEYMINNYDKYSKCRNIAQKYLDSRLIAKKLLKVLIDKNGI